MAGWLWVGVVIVMPAFTEGQQSDPKTISGGIRRWGTGATPTCEWRS
jgi:hypothetical protein